MYTYNYKSVVGYYEKRGKMSVTNRLKFLPYAQAGYDDYNGKVKKLYSYDSFIMEVHSDGLCFVNTTAFFSKTTKSHVNTFLREIGSTWKISDLQKEYKDGRFHDGYFVFNAYKR